MGLKIYIKTLGYMDLKSLISEATPSTTQFFKRSYQISHNPGLWASLDALPSFAASSKSRLDFSKKVVSKLKLPKNYFNKKCTVKIYTEHVILFLMGLKLMTPPLSPHFNLNLIEVKNLAKTGFDFTDWKSRVLTTIYTWRILTHMAKKVANLQWSNLGLIFANLLIFY